MSSSSHMRRLLALLLGFGVTFTAFGSLAVAQEPAPAGFGDRFSFGAAAGVGAVATGRPDDAPDAPTLLNGSGYSGLALRLQGHAQFKLSQTLRLRAALAFARYRMSGFAETGSTRRELAFDLNAVELLPSFEFQRDLGPVILIAGVDAGVRFGLSANATEQRTGFASETPAPAVRTAINLLAGAHAGVAIDLGAIQIPITGVALWNVTYPDTTLERLPDFQSTESPGAYTVDNDFVFLALVGVDWST
ncbi:MAG: hypothetical protein KGO50_02060 [Myxococcales bacterium]|nr:hypothetical protein [Myxococcales bacterium]